MRSDEPRAAQAAEAPTKINTMAASLRKVTTSSLDPAAGGAPVADRIPSEDAGTRRAESSADRERIVSSR
jgi:hypothetical protein